MFETVQNCLVNGNPVAHYRKRVTVCLMTKAKTIFNALAVGIYVMVAVMGSRSGWGLWVTILLMFAAGFLIGVVEHLAFKEER